MYRLAAIPVWEVFNAIEAIAPTERYKKRRLQIPGTKYTYKLQRPMIFLDIGTTCVHCGVEGTYFALEEWVNGDLHFELYGRDEEGCPVMITIDHILPRSKGGPNRVSNYQALCRPCNEAKGDFQLSQAQVNLLVKAHTSGGKLFNFQYGIRAAIRYLQRIRGLVEHGLVEVIQTIEMDGVEEPLPAIISITPLGKMMLPWAQQKVEKAKLRELRKPELGKLKRGSVLGWGL